MKKITLLSILFCALSAQAQVEIREFSSGQEVGSDISGTTVSLTATSNGSVAKAFSVKNVSGSLADLKVGRLRLNTPPVNWTDGLSWAPNPDPNFEGQCFAGGQMSTNPWSTPNSVSISDQNRATLTIDVYVDGPGCGQYRYYIIEGTTPIDSIDVEVCFNLGVEDDNEISFSVYPNPANNTVTLALPSDESSYLITVYDLKGTAVELPAPTHHTLDFGAAMNGVYTIVISDEQGNCTRREVVINH